MEISTAAIMGMPRRIVEAPDVTLAIVGMFFSIVLIGFASVSTARLVFLPVAVLIFAACGGWLLIRQKFSLSLPALPVALSFLPLSIGVLSFMILTELSWYLRPDIYQRPIIFFLLVSITVGLMVFQAMGATKRDVPIFLIEVLILALILAWSELSLFPSLLGEDPWSHLMFTRELVTTHAIPSGAYSGLPLFHLLIASSWLLSAPTYKLAAALSVSLAQIIVNIVVVYLIGRELIGDHRVGMVAGLFVAISNQNIFMSYWSIPNAFAGLFIPVILYILLVRKEDPPLVRGIALGLSMAALIMTHSVTATCMAILLVVLWAVSVAYRWLYGESNFSIPWFVPVAFLIGMLTWWYLATDLIHVLADLINVGFKPEVFDTSPPSLNLLLAQAPLWERIFNYLGYFLFFSLSLVGLLALLRGKEGSRMGFAIAGATPLLMGFGSLVTGFAIIYERWWYFSEILLAVPLGIAVVGLFSTYSDRFKRIAVAWPALGSIVVVTTLALVMSPAANIDNHLLSPNTQATFALRASEMDAATTMIQGSHLVRTDRYLMESMLRLGYYLEPFDTEIFSRDLDPLRPDLVLLRGTVVCEPFKIYSTLYKPKYDLGEEFEKSRFSRVYQNGGVDGYAASSGKSAAG